MFFLRIICCLIFINHIFAYGFILKTVWGPEKFSPTIISLVLHKSLYRLHGVDQYGAFRYFGFVPPFSKYDHSVEILALLQRAGVSFEEQVAGLFHNTSHATFSNIDDDHLFLPNGNQVKSYQDMTHLEFLKKMQVDQAVGRYNISINQMNPYLPEYKALARPLPDICADSLQYIIHTGVILNKITTKQAKSIINDANFDGEKWFFTDKNIAKTLGNLSIYFTKEFWGSPHNFIFSKCFSHLLKHSVSVNLIKLEDIQYGTDDYIINALKSSQDPVIEAQIKIFTNVNNYFSITTFAEDNESVKNLWNIKPKCYAVDPFIKTTGGTLKRISEYDRDFRENFEDISTWCKQGYGIKLRNYDNNLFD